MRMSRRVGLGTAGLAIAAIGCGLAMAAGATLPFTGDGDTIAGCYSSGGALKVRTPSEPTCPKGYEPISWGVTGPQGPSGPQGAQGPQGPQGEPGDSGHEVLYANVRHDGTLTAGDATTSELTATGVYWLTFARATAGCAAVVTAGQSTTSDSTTGDIVAKADTGVGKYVIVSLQDGKTGGLFSTSFHLILVCPR
jgi:hypothetical protein